jgi:hypothetical protein
MYLDLLKKLYYEERKKLEGMWIYRQETKLKVIRLKKFIIEKLEKDLNVSELEGRDDIAEEIKDRLLRDGNNQYKVEERLSKNIQEEILAVSKDEQEELRNTNYNADEYADYLLQSEKVYALEAEMIEKGLYPEGVYGEQKDLAGTSGK